MEWRSFLCDEDRLQLDLLLKLPDPYVPRSLDILLTDKLRLSAVVVKMFSEDDDDPEGINGV